MIGTTVSLAVDDREGALNQALLYPLRFEAIYQYRLWGGRHLANLLTTPLPSGPVGEAWILSDRDDHQSKWPKGLSKGRPSVNCYSSFQNRCWEGWPTSFGDFHCC